MKKVTKIALVVLALIITMPIINSCKKGENDPFLSLSSRDGRITAKWKLTKIEGTSKEINSFSTETITYSYNGTTYTVTETVATTSGTVTTTETGSGTYEMTIDKNGIYSYNESYTESGGSLEVSTSDAQWVWFDNDKSKTMIMLDGGGTLFGGNIYVVDRLTKKELVLIVKYSSSNSYGGSTSSDDMNITYTFEAK